MAYLLDTDVVIDFMKKKEPSFSLVKKLLGNDIYISVINFIEIFYGIKKTKNIQKRTNEFQIFLNQINPNIIPIDITVAKKFIDLKINLENNKMPLADFDLLIASICIQYRLTLITRNQKHFSRIKNLKIYG
ncbi:MAG: type II toxin-antitoxin system VapC family toxin [Microgenomates group bacterium]